MTRLDGDGRPYRGGMGADRSAFGAFLRARRDRLTPGQAGIEAFPGPRRVPGLRREELAMLAGLSTDHYSRLEQGRQATVSESVLAALTRALRLNEVEAAHLRDLAAPASRARRTAPEVQHPDPGLLRLAATLDHVPVLLLGRRAEVLAHNALLRAVLGRAPALGSSFTHYLFRDPLARERIVNWAEFGARSVAAMRRRPADDRRTGGSWPRWTTCGAPTRTSPAGGTTTPCGTTPRWPSASPIRAGLLDFHIEIVAAPHAPDQHLVVYTAEPGSSTARMLPLLASWAAPADTPTGPRDRPRD